MQMYIIEVGLIITFITCLFLFYRLHLDTKNLKNFIHNRHRSFSTNSPLFSNFSKCFYPQIESIWRSLLLFSNQKNLFKITDNTYKRLISLTENIALASDNEEAISQSVCNLLMSELSPEIASVGIILKDQKNQASYISHIEGISQKRVSETILSCFDEMLLDTMNSKAYFRKYLTKKDDILFDLSTFDIALSLFIPIHASSDKTSEICGAIWLGLKTIKGGIQAERLELIQAISEHVAASFNASRTMKKLLERGSSERDFLLGVSHDIRAPLVRALAAINEVNRKESSLSLIDRECIKIAHESLAEQHSLLGDLFDCARGERGLLRASKAEISLKNILHEAIGDFNEKARAKGLKWNFDINLLPEDFIIFDPMHFRRIITNLLNNALKYTMEGEISLKVIRSKEFIEIIIEDTGIGILPDDQEIIFNTFKRGENSDISTGLGLGLRLCACLTEINNGFLCYRPRINQQGSSFILSVPISKSNHVYTNFSQLKLHKNLNFLVVEDDPFLANLIKRVLVSVSSNVSISNSIEDALSKITNKSPDFVVTDFHLGSYTAVDFINALPESTPVIILTSDISGSAINLTISRKNTLFIEKPFNEELLLADIFRFYQELSFEENVEELCA